MLANWLELKVLNIGAAFLINLGFKATSVQPLCPEKKNYLKKINKQLKEIQQTNLRGF